MRRARAALLAMLLALLCGAAPAADDPLLGFWRSPPEPGGESSMIELFIEGGQLHGRIARSYDASGREVEPVCEKCPGALAGKPARGMRFIQNLHRDGDHWSGGRVVDLRPGATQGVTANCEIRFDHGKAVVLGYVGARFLGSTSTWQRATPPH